MLYLRKHNLHARYFTWILYCLLSARTGSGSCGLLPLNRIGPQWFLLVLILFNAIYCCWAFARKSAFLVDNTKPVLGWRSWMISAATLGALELAMGHFSGFWTDLKDSNFDGLGYQGMHLWTYGFLFFVGCKAASHQWLERINKRLALRWLYLSLVATLALMTANYAPFILSHSKESLELITPLMAFSTPFIGWGFIAAILSLSQANEQLDSHWLAKAGKDSFGAYLIHIPVLAGAMLSCYSLGIKNIWILGFGATLAEPALNALGATVQELTNGAFKKGSLKNH